jgi:O-acetyl-ADP-ribose deacetylase (regulator of RNase III)
MKQINGDLISLAKNGQFDVIVHGCNCFNTMGAGIAKLIKSEFPEAYKADLQTEKGSKDKLGTISFAKSGDLTIINAYTQHNWRGRGIKADYEAIRRAFKEIKLQFSGSKIGYPAIGAGLAGGDWEVIAQIISEELNGEDHTLVVYSP